MCDGKSRFTAYDAEDDVTQQSPTDMVDFKRSLAPMIREARILRRPASRLRAEPDCLSNPIRENSQSPNTPRTASGGILVGLTLRFRAIALIVLKRPKESFRRVLERLLGFILGLHYQC